MMQTLTEKLYLGMVVLAMALFVLVIGFVSLTYRDPQPPE